MNEGYIYLLRRFVDTSFFKDSIAVHLAIYLMLKANYRDSKFIFDGKELIIKRGQLVSGRNKISEDTGINPSSVYVKMKLLSSEKINFINIKPNNKFSIITIVKYEEIQSLCSSRYQQIDNANNIKNESPITTKKQQNNNKITQSNKINTNNKYKTKTICQSASENSKDLFCFCQLILKTKPIILNNNRARGFDNICKIYDLNKIKLAIIEMRQDKGLLGENKNGKDYFTIEYITRKEDNILRYLELAIKRFKLDNLPPDELNIAIGQKVREYLESHHPDVEYTRNFGNVPDRRTEKRMDDEGDDKRPRISERQDEQGTIDFENQYPNIHGSNLLTRT